MKFISHSSAVHCISRNEALEKLKERHSSKVARVPVRVYDVKVGSICSQSSTFWCRYIDDIFMIWTRSVQDLNTFTSFLNGVHPTIKFTCDHSSHPYPFLTSKSHFAMAKLSLTFTPNLQTNTNTYYIRRVIPYTPNVLFLLV